MKTTVRHGKRGCEGGYCHLLITSFYLLDTWVTFTTERESEGMREWRVVQQAHIGVTANEGRG